MAMRPYPLPTDDKIFKIVAFPPKLTLLYIAPMLKLSSGAIIAK